MNARHTRARIRAHAQRGRAETEEEGSKRVTIKLIDSSRAHKLRLWMCFSLSLSAWLVRYIYIFPFVGRFVFFRSIRRCNFFFPSSFTHLLLPSFLSSSIISIILRHGSVLRIVCTGDVKEKKARISCFRRNTSCWPGRISISRGGRGGGTRKLFYPPGKSDSWSKNNRWIVKPYFRRLEER